MELGDNNGFFTAATINVGSAATIIVSADTAEATLPIGLDPETNRVFLRFSDELGVVRGATSVAVQNGR